MNLQAMARVCILMQALHCLEGFAIDLMVDVLNMVKQQQERHNIVPDEEEDRFWTDLDEKVSNMGQMSLWLNVETLHPLYDPVLTGSLTIELLSGFHEAVCGPHIPASYEHLYSNAYIAMRALKERLYGVLTGGRRPDNKQDAVVLVMNVFEKVYDLLELVVPLIRDELLEVVDGPPNGEFNQMTYKMKHQSEAGDMNTAIRMQDVMKDRIETISVIAQS